MVIIDMDMPKSCWECRIKNLQTCPIINEYVGDCFDEEIRHEKCPIHTSVNETKAQ